MDISNKPQEEVVAGQGVREIAPKNQGGRPSVEEDLDLQIEYYMIHHARTVQSLTVAEIAKAKGISPQKVYFALDWVRSHHEVGDAQSNMADSMAAADARIRDYNKDIMEAEKGFPLVVEGVVIRNKDGTPFLMVDREYVRKLKRDRAAYDFKKMELRGQIGKTQVILNKTLNVQGGVNVDIRQVQELTKHLPESDRKQLAEIIGKNGRPPSSNR